MRYLMTVLFSVAMAGSLYGIYAQGRTGSQQQSIPQGQSRDQGRQADVNRGAASSSAKGQHTSRTTTGQHAGTAATDHDFVRKAASGGMMEVEVGKLAQQRGSSARVKQIGRRLERDHSRANRELAAIAKSQGLTLPEEMDQGHRAHVDQLRNLSGQEFDARFLEMQAEHHQKDIAEFQQRASKGENPRLRNFAGKQVPVLQEHLAMIEGDSGSASREGASRSTDTQGRRDGTSRGNPDQEGEKKK